MLTKRFQLAYVYFPHETKQKAKGSVMSINTIITLNSHTKNIISSLKSTKDLPFRDVLSSEIISEYTQTIEYKGRYNFYPPDITLWAFLSQVIDDNQTLESAVARVIAFHVSKGKDAPSPNTAAFSKARSRFPEEMISNLVKDSAEKMEENIPNDWLWNSLHLKLVDGSTVSMPDTQENQSLYPQPDSQKKGVGFPIARIVVVISCVTGAVLDLAIGPYSGKESGEHALLRQIIDVFKPGDVALGDAYYASFFLIAMLMKKGVNFIFPQHSARNSDFRQGKKLGKKDHIVKWIKPKKPEWMDQEIYDSFQNEVEIREVVIRSEKKGFRAKERIIVTNFFNPTEVSRNNLSKLYSYRWWIELDIRTIKQTMHMGILKGKTPEMVHKEIWAHLLAYNLIRKIMAEAAYEHNKKPRELSFTLAMNLIEAFREAGILEKNKEENYTALLKAIARRTIYSRPGRQEPRVVKRRPKAFPRMQKPRHLYHRDEAMKNAIS
jgi:DDE family transposase